MCTTFTFQRDKSFVLAQNYDFYYGHGLIVVSPRGLMKQSLTKDAAQKVTWVSNYGTVTFTQFGRELPMSGMNEKGLTIAMMHQEDGQFPAEDDRPGLNELQWIQYQLDQFKSVEEVIEHVEDFRLEKSVYELHYTIADSTGRTALIDFIDGVCHVTEHAECYTMTNTSYEKSIAHAKKFEKSPLENFSNKTTSLDRFCLVNRLVKDVQSQSTLENPIQKSFELLEKVAAKPSDQTQWEWVGNGVPPTFTYWSIVFDIYSQTIYYRDLQNHEIRSIHLDDFHFSNEVMALALDNKASGRISSQFQPYETKDNERIILLSYEPMSDIFPLNEQRELINYPDSIKRVL
ncbi:linear amide C-N hydrolase [Evansella cellulosilytica]|uniref:Choloylglycine hydrolase n=1 Tax=Evansella cellulosilytica (strain ATCC 21833 / DSM 2522 / FERM P-1141 / JCM 9156 / N-4) TaxID=649639 RepID=E6TR00_EVAC2|nr:linear amide C-N hydrolase [Evansella cellulosilytica]ADU29376.1 Choloylglycine hydrolase [Evansella cellulosilytica DSM 2522]